MACKFSIICCYTNKELMHEMLVSSLEKQTFKDYEFLPINNKELGFVSASETLNYASNNAIGEILVYAHQDLSLVDEDFLKKLCAFCDEYEFGVAGVAGVVGKEKQVFSSVTMDIDYRIAGKQLNEVKEVDALDECLFIIKKDNFMKFDNLGDTWHFYAVEYSIRCKLANKKVLLFPLSVYHLSPGWSLNDNYWKTLKLLAKKYRSTHKKIYTCMGSFRTDILLPFEIILRKIKRKLFRKR